jgi:hypothetical protein
MEVLDATAYVQHTLKGAIMGVGYAILPPVPYGHPDETRKIQSWHLFQIVLSYNRMSVPK